MLAIRVKSYFSGYAIIKIEGIDLEQFINCAVSNNILFWDIERIGFTTLRASVNLKDYKRLRDIRREINCRITIIEKRGYPFLLNRISKRKALIAGGIIAILTMYSLTSFLWVVEVEGNKNVPDERIVYELERAGLRPGTFKPFIKTKDIEIKLLIGIDELIWASVNVLGTRAIVEVVERIEPPPLIDKSVPCNIVAKKDGIIVNTYVFEGQGTVEKGDTVQVGQVLISGIVGELDKPTRLVHAMGRVEARVWYKLTDEQPLRLVERKRTGQVKRTVFVKLGDRRLKLSPGGCRFLHYDTVTSVNRIIEWRNIASPIELIIENHYEVTAEERYLTVKAAVEQAVDRILKRVTDALPDGAEITDKNVKYTKTDDETVKVEVLFETLEDIALKERIDINYRED